MATSTWPWRLTMRARVRLTGFTASPRFERRGIMCRKCRTLTSGRDQDVLPTLTSIPAQSTKTSPRKAASYSLTNKRVSVFSFPFSVRDPAFSVFNSQFLFLRILHLSSGGALFVVVISCARERNWGLGDLSFLLE